MPAKEHTNRLIHEKSPYLLQHAHNPVDWYPWCDEAFDKAKAEDKPVFLSIGYSVCHWCHVMEHESFEDEEVAAALNRGFVSVKVDREERPDVDAFYMDACLALSGAGGWPLSCFLGHDRLPFYAGTYFPKENGPFGAGFLTLLSQVSRLWRENRAELAPAAEALTRALREQTAAQTLRSGRCGAAYRLLSRRFDPDFGGFSPAPKFPAPQILLFLLRYGLAQREPRALQMARKTLECMADGGVFDQLGGGFCRYSTDREWLVPHFEKMMVDNALHLLAYAEASALFGEAFADISRRVAGFCLREMLDPQGGFYTALDADSAGGEGACYLFTPGEVERVLGPRDAPRFCEMYGITPAGNFEGGSIPNRIGAGLADTRDDFARRSRQKLLREREKRPQPLRDDKVTTSVCGLMTGALATAGRILGEREYLAAAERCADFALRALEKNGRLLNRWRAGEAGVPAGCDDYACLIGGLLGLYEATLAPRRLAQAVRLAQEMRALFWDEAGGGYFLTGSDVADLPTRKKQFADGALPSGNAMMAVSLIWLARLCGESAYERDARRILEAAAPVLNAQPDACCGLLTALLWLEQGGAEVILVRGGGFEALCGAFPAFSPFLTVSACGEGFEEIYGSAPYLREYQNAQGRAAAYVCRGGSCLKPVASPEELSDLLARPE
jgi:uncharacterized protein YyaL (SSP411 family)